MSNWQPGDMAVVCDCVTAPQFNGKIVTVTSNEYMQMDNDGIDKPCVDIDSGSMGWVGAFIEVLRKPYDPLEPASWEDMKDIWAPKELEAVV